MYLPYVFLHMDEPLYMCLHYYFCLYFIDSIGSWSTLSATCLVINRGQNFDYG